jgi:hypothetical protein
MTLSFTVSFEVRNLDRSVAEPMAKLSRWRLSELAPSS